MLLVACSVYGRRFMCRVGVQNTRLCMFLLGFCLRFGAVGACTFPFFFASIASDFWCRLGSFVGWHGFLLLLFIYTVASNFMRLIILFLLFCLVFFTCMWVQRHYLFSFFFLIFDIMRMVGCSVFQLL